MRNQSPKSSCYLAAILAILLVLTVVLAVPSSAQAASSVMIAENGVNIRSGPGTNYPVVGIAQQGQTFPRVNDLNINGFYPIFYNGQEAFVSADLVSLSGSAEASPASAVVILDNAVNVRSGPGTNYTVIGVAVKGESFGLLASEAIDGYYKVSYYGAEGYVSALLVTITGQAAAAAPVEAAAPSPAAYQSVVIADSSVNIRSGPGTNYEILGVASRGEKFPLTSEVPTNSFYSITYQGMSAYVNAPLVTLSAEAAPASGGTGFTLMLRTTSSSYTEAVRSKPTSSASRIGTLKNGDTLELLSTKTYNSSGGATSYYYKVNYNGQVGYVLTRYADIIHPLPAQCDYSAYGEYIRITNTTQRVYPQPASSGAIDSVYKADILPLIGIADNGFYQVEYDGQIAYIPTDAASRITPAALPASSASWVAVVVRGNQTVSVYHDGTLVRFMSCSTGASSTPTPKGTYTVPYRKNYFVNHDLTCFDAIKAIEGTGIYFHRIPRRPSGSYSGFQEALGSKASAGCIRLPEVHSRWMFANFPNGGTVVIRD